METLSHNPELQVKIGKACEVIEQSLSQAKRPCVLCSFGKDSVLMLYMIREWFTKDLEVVFFKNPWFPRKTAFAERVISDWELNVHSQIPPIASSMSTTDTGCEIVRHYQVGSKPIYLPLGRQPIDLSPNWLCGRETILGSPHGTYQWPWDLAFHGHKASDTDPVQGEVPIEMDIHQNYGAASFAYPLRTFTDEDVWELTRKFELPFNKLRHKTLESPENDKNDFWNPDYLPYCTECLDRRKEKTVTCPKTRLKVTNISSQINHVEVKLDYIGGK